MKNIEIVALLRRYETALLEIANQPNRMPPNASAYDRGFVDAINANVLVAKLALCTKDKIPSMRRSGG